MADAECDRIERSANVWELHRKIRELETQLAEETTKRYHAEGLVEAWKVKWEWDCKK